MERRKGTPSSDDSMREGGMRRIKSKDARRRLSAIGGESGSVSDSKKRLSAKQRLSV